MGTREQEAIRGCVGDLITWKTPSGGIGEGEICSETCEAWWVVEPFGARNTVDVFDGDILEITKPSKRRDRRSTD